MLGIIGRKSLTTAIIASVLFYVFANPSTFKMVKKLPGLKFVMKSATEITHSGVAVHAALFCLMMMLIVHVINGTMLKEYLHVVEGFDYMAEGMDGEEGEE